MKHSLRNFLRVLHGSPILCKFVYSKKKRWVIVFLFSWKKNRIVDLDQNKQNLFYFYQLIIKIIPLFDEELYYAKRDNSTQAVTSSTLKGKWQEPARSESCICAKEERCVQHQNDLASRSNAFKSITLCIRNVFKKKKKKEIAYERDIDWDKNGKTARRRSNRIKTEKDP